MPSDTDWTPTAQVTRSRRGSVRCRYTATRSQTPRSLGRRGRREANMVARIGTWEGDRKSTRLNSSHGYISYAVFCLKKKKKRINNDHLESTHNSVAPMSGQLVGGQDARELT